MKFLQVHTFYPFYLIDFYKKKTGLSEAPFEDQVHALIMDCFSGGHIIAPYLETLGYCSKFLVANSKELQNQWFKENNIFLPSFEKESLRDFFFVKEYIDSFKPDILYLTDPVVFNDSFIKHLNHKPSLIIGWRSAPTKKEVSWRSFDVIISNNYNCKTLAKQFGVRNVQTFFPGFPNIVNMQLKNIPQKYDVIFSGQYRDNHKTRNQLLKYIADASTGPVPFTYAYHLALDMPVTSGIRYYNAKWGLDMFRVLKEGKISFNAHIDYADNKCGGNMRLFESTGVGAFSLVEWKPVNLDSYFESGKEIETFRSKDELIEKIHYYLDHPKERELIAKNGQERCLRDYSMEVKAKEFDQIIRKYLTQKGRFPLSFNTTSKIRDKAIEHINKNEFQKAFDLIIQAKSRKEPVYNLDFIKAICFLNMNKIVDAIESLKEELRYFPQNLEAKKFLDQLMVNHNQSVSNTINDLEFLNLFKNIQAYTMLSEKRLFSLYILSRHICINDLPGNFVECGVAAGGSSALIAYVIKKYSKSYRHLYAFDSFEGMPQPSNEDVLSDGANAQSIGWGTGTCAAPKQYVIDMWKKLNVADIIIPVEGYFENTLPPKREEIGNIALLHLDGDWYHSTKSILHNFYDHLITGGILQVDDYGHWAGCKKAIHEFEANNNLKFVLNNIDNTGVWFIKQ